MKKLLSKYKRIVLESINSLLCCFFKMLPVQNRVFFYSIRSDGVLTDNEKAIYNKLSCKKTYFAKKLPHSAKYKPRIYYLLLTSKVIVTDDYLRYIRYTELRPGQKVIQVWHACGAFKKFALDAKTALSEKEERLTHRQYTDVCVSSDAVRQHYASAFGISIDKIKATGIPRTDILFDEAKIKELRQAFLNRHPEFAGKKIYVYAPTFREKNKKVIAFDPKIDFHQLDQTLNDHEVLLITRHIAMKNEFPGSQSRSRIFDVTEEETLVLLATADVVITDYSSVIFEACLLNKPIVFYCPDYDGYERSFYIEYPEELPGELVCSDKKLLAEIRSALSKGVCDKYRQFKTKELSACDGHATQRIVDLIYHYIGEKP